MRRTWRDNGPSEAGLDRDVRALAAAAALNGVTPDAEHIATALVALGGPVAELEGLARRVGVIVAQAKRDREAFALENDPAAQARIQAETDAHTRAVSAAEEKARADAWAKLTKQAGR